MGHPTASSKHTGLGVRIGDRIPDRGRSVSVYHHSVTRASKAISSKRVSGSRFARSQVRYSVYLSEVGISRWFHPSSHPPPGPERTAYRVFPRDHQLGLGSQAIFGTLLRVGRQQEAKVYQSRRPQNSCHGKPACRAIRLQTSERAPNHLGRPDMHRLEEHRGEERPGCGHDSHLQGGDADHDLAW